MRLVPALAFAGWLTVCAAARADTYSLSFVSDRGPQVGTGSITFEGPSPDATDESYTVVPLTGVNVTFDTGATFTASDLIAPANVVFRFGEISDYDINLSTATAGLSTLSFNYFYLDANTIDSGQISSQLIQPSSVTPEPSGLVLLGSGLLGILGCGAPAGARLARLTRCVQRLQLRNRTVQALE